MSQCTHHRTCGDCFSPEAIQQRDEQIATLTRQLARYERLDVALGLARSEPTAAAAVARIVAILDGPCLGCDLDNGQHRFSCARYGKNAPRLPAVMAPEPDTRPMLTEWRRSGAAEKRFIGDNGDVWGADAIPRGEWAVWDETGNKEIAGGKAVDLASAKRAADTAAREFYRLPEDAKEPK